MGKRTRAQKEKRAILASALTAVGMAEATEDVISKFNDVLNEAGYHVQRKPSPSCDDAWKGRTPPRSWL